MGINNNVSVQYNGGFYPAKPREESVSSQPMLPPNNKRFDSFSSDCVDVLKVQMRSDFSCLKRAV